MTVDDLIREIQQHPGHLDVVMSKQALGGDREARSVVVIWPEEEL